MSLCPCYTVSLKWRRAACGPSSCVRLNFCGSSFVTRCSPTHKPRYRLKELAELFPTVYRFEGRRATGEEREQPKVEAQRRAACGPSGRHLRDTFLASLIIPSTRNPQEPGHRYIFEAKDRGRRPVTGPRHPVRGAGRAAPTDTQLEASFSLETVTQGCQRVAGPLGATESHGTD